MKTYTFMLVFGALFAPLHCEADLRDPVLEKNWEHFQAKILTYLDQKKPAPLNLPKNISLEEEDLCTYFHGRQVAKYQDFKGAFEELQEVFSSFAHSFATVVAHQAENSHREYLYTKTMQDVTDWYIDYTSKHLLDQ